MIKNRHSRLLIAGFALLLSVAPAARAQEGPFIGYQLGYQSYQGDVTGSGTTAGLRFGYAASGPVSFGLRAGVGASGTYQVAGTVEYLFRRRHPFRPFVQAGWGLYSTRVDVTSDEDQIRLKGNGPDVGLGFDYFVNERSSLGLAVTERFVRYDRPSDPRFRSDLDSRSTLVVVRWNVYYR